MIKTAFVHSLITTVQPSSSFSVGEGRVTFNMSGTLDVSNFRLYEAIRAHGIWETLSLHGGIRMSCVIE
jgi:hypothetical protein